MLSFYQYNTYWIFNMTNAKKNINSKSQELADVLGTTAQPLLLRGKHTL